MAVEIIKCDTAVYLGILYVLVYRYLDEEKQKLDRQVYEWLINTDWFKSEHKKFFDEAEKWLESAKKSLDTKIGK